MPCICFGMTWKAVRLELGRTEDFPNGSAGRAYLMRVPIDPSGMIDEVAVNDSPHQATVRRYWPNQPDRAGHLIRSLSGWRFSYVEKPPENDIPDMPDAPIRLGECLYIREADGNDLPFRVMCCEG